jgi:hypothetical protein
MNQFDQNAERVVTFLREQKYTASTVYAHKKCYSELRTHLTGMISFVRKGLIHEGGGIRENIFRPPNQPKTSPRRDKMARNCKKAPPWNVAQNSDGTMSKEAPD